MLANVKQATIKPLIMASLAKGALIYTDAAILNPSASAISGHDLFCDFRGRLRLD